MLFLISLMAGVVNAQSSMQNYIVTTIPIHEVQDPTNLVDNNSSLANSNSSIQYFDGLGRLSQTVQKAITPTGTDLVSGIMYDSFGRDSLKWLPGAAASGNNGAYITNYANLSVNTNGYDTKPYALTEYESSPLNRVTGLYGPGDDWYANGKKKAIEYTTNASDVKLFYVENDQLKCSGVYSKATLYGQKTTDEDGKTVEEFTDKQGRKVLSRVASDYDTYYVYDDRNNLRYVLPPMAADVLGGTANWSNDEPVLKQYGYLYVYDGRKRCTAKRLPGCDWIYMAYDKADRLVMSQDGNQRAKQQWTVNKYDVFGRLLYSGLANDNRSGDVMVHDCKDLLFTETTGSSTVPGYTCNNVTPATLLTINYYDSYDFLFGLASTLGYQVLSGYDKAYPENATDASSLIAKGLLTGTRIYHLDDSTKYEATALYYDKYGRVVQTRTSNHLGGYDITYNALDFTGKPTATKKTHGISGASDTYTELYTYTYDKAQRLLETTHSLNGAVPISLSKNKYDKLGRLLQKTIQNGLDYTSYAYNVRSWPTNISGMHFYENLYYNTNTTNITSFTPAFNGNISAMKWNISDSLSVGFGNDHVYTFGYDPLNRLTDASYIKRNGSGDVSGTSGMYDETFGYDKMGNITTLTRNENGAGLNELTLDYTGNQLKKVDDNPAKTLPYGSEAFNDRKQLTTEYAYDANGSITYDANSGISTIQYNVLNLPNTIQFTEGHQNLYTYDAGGKKLRANNYTLHNPVNVPQGNISTLPANSGDYTQMATDYVGNMIYENGSLKEILLPEGYWQGGVYYYYLKDHLGDNRVTINSSGNVVEKSHYYPSGMRFYPESSSNSAALPYRYNGKELEAMNGLNQYDYGARRRGAGLPIWTAVDPLAEKYYAISPYVYCNNSPVKLVDPDGMDWFYNNQTGAVVYFSSLKEGAEKGMEKGWQWMGENDMFKKDNDDYANSDRTLAAQNGGDFQKNGSFSMLLNKDKAKKFMEKQGYDFKPTQQIRYESEINFEQASGTHVTTGEKTYITEKSGYVPKGSIENITTPLNDGRYNLPATVNRFKIEYTTNIFVKGLNALMPFIGYHDMRIPTVYPSLSAYPWNNTLINKFLRVYPITTK